MPSFHFASGEREGDITEGPEEPQKVQKVEEAEYPLGKIVPQPSKKRKTLPEGITPYEKERLERIERNRKVMAGMGVTEAWQDFHRSVLGERKAPRVTKTKEPRPTRIVSEPRRSARLDPAQQPVYDDDKAFKALMRSVRFHLKLSNSRRACLQILSH